MAEDGDFADEVGRVERALFDTERWRVDGELRAKVPTMPGIYAIFVDHSKDLLETSGERCVKEAVKSIVKQMNEGEAGNRGLLYVGITESSLVKRLVHKNLHGRGASSFFRSLGAVLGCAPCKGSLSSPKSSNYKFNKDDKAKIVAWIKEHLSVTCVDDFGSVADIKPFETVMIRKYSPIFNIKENGNPSEDLQNLREQCLKIARG